MKNVVKWSYIYDESVNSKFLIITCRWSTEFWKRTSAALADNHVTSPIFLAGDDNEFAWEIIINPRTRNFLKNIRIRVFEVNSTEWDYTISFLKKDLTLEKIKLFEDDLVFDFNSFESLKQMSADETLSEEDVDEDDDYYISDDCLTKGGAVISIIAGFSVKVKDVQNYKASNSFERLFRYESSIVVKNLLEKLLDNPSFGDVTFIIGEKKLKAHTAVLATMSPVFLEKFKNKTIWRKKSHFEIKITDFQLNTIKEMLHFMYTGQLRDQGEESLKQILMISSKYRIKDLFFRCQDALLIYLSIDNALELLTLAGVVDAEDLKLSSIDVITDNIEKVDTSKLSDLKPELLKKIFNKIATDKNNKNQNTAIIEG